MSAAYTIPGPPLGYGFDVSTLDAAGNRHTVICADGPFLIILFVYTSGAIDRPHNLALLQVQLAALGPS